MSDLIQATNPTRTLTLGGKDYRVPKIGPREFGELQQWLADRTPNPKDEARKYMDGLPEAVQIHMWDKALDAARSWPPQLSGDPRAIERILTDPSGQATLLFVVLRKTTPGITIEEAGRIAEGMDFDDFGNLWATVMPESDGPKAPAAETTTPA